MNEFHESPGSWRPLVYICSPYADDPEGNTGKARKYSRFAVDEGCIPLAPHLLLPQYMDEETERELAMYMNKVILSKCEEVWVFGERLTAGMAEEIQRANKWKKKIRFFTEDCKEVSSRDV